MTFTLGRDGKEITVTPNVTQSYDEDTATLTFTKVTMDMDGEYKCVAENSAGTTETVAKVTVEGNNFISHYSIEIVYSFYRDTNK